MKKILAMTALILLLTFLMPAAFADGGWQCSVCKAENQQFNFCSICGSQRPQFPTADQTGPIQEPPMHTHTLAPIALAKDPTCLESGYTSGIMCGVCGEVLEYQIILPKKDHNWQSASCTAPETCKNCGLTRGEMTDHTWRSNGTTSVCINCGRTGGVYLNDMTWMKKNCKFYYYSFDPVTFPHNLNWNDINTNGYIASTRDVWDNVYQYGMHLDSGSSAPYWVEYDIGGKYTKFTGTLSSPFETAGGTRAPAYWLKWNEYYKIVTIYLDGKPVWTSPHITETSQPVEIDLNVTGARIFRVEYSGSDYSNEIAVLYDAMFS